jgi:hypothetical protein
MSEAKSCLSWLQALTVNAVGLVKWSKLPIQTGAAAKAGASRLMTTLSLHCVSDAITKLTKEQSYQKWRGS